MSAVLPQGEIRATAFNDQVDKFFPLLELNKVRGGGVGVWVCLPRSAEQRTLSVGPNRRFLLSCVRLVLA